MIFTKINYLNKKCTWFYYNFLQFRKHLHKIMKYVPIFITEMYFNLVQYHIFCSNEVIEYIIN